MEKNEQTQWIKNPLLEKWEGLKFGAQLSVKPYYGKQKKITLHRTQYVIGSLHSADIPIDDPFVSKTHAEIILGDDKLYSIRDCNSKNGIFMNGTRVTEAHLPPQAILRIGRSLLSWNMNKSFTQHVGAVSLGNIVAESQSMKEILNQVYVAAKSDLPVLLLGETGVGKDEIAQLIHHWSSRVNQPYIAVNAARASGALVDSEIFGHKKGSYTGSEENRLGALMAAHKGTFFLDELGDLPLDTQAKFLRVLEGGEVKAVGSDTNLHSNFRLIAATSKDLGVMVKDEKFRVDLYYRVSGFVIRIPPLRERKLDIIPIAKFLLEKEGMVLSEDCVQKLLLHHYPGNVRELKSVILRAITVARAAMRVVVLEGDIDFPLLTWKVPACAVERAVTLALAEKEIICYALTRSGGSKVQAAKDLGISRSTLFEKIKKYQIYSNITS